MEIDYSNWGDFLIEDLFIPANAGNILARDVDDGSGNTPFVTSSGINNGVVAHIDASRYELIPGHCILIGGKTFTLTYQKDDFVSNDSHNIVIRLKNQSATQQVYLFIVSVIRAALSKKYEWADAVTKDKLIANTIKLPAKDNEPDWEYMHDYINDITEKAKENLSILKSIIYRGGQRLEIAKWKSYPMTQLFKIVPGTRLRKQDMKEGDINYVGASAFNNGVTAKIGNNENIHPAGTITVCYNGSIGQAFYQNEPFWATDDVNVLYPKFYLTPGIAKFIIPIIFKLSSKYAYIDKWTASRMESTHVPLPASASGNPDWNFMENYIEALTLKADSISNAFFLV